MKELKVPEWNTLSENEQEEIREILVKSKSINADVNISNDDENTENFAGIDEASVNIESFTNNIQNLGLGKEDVCKLACEAAYIIANAVCYSLKTRSGTASQVCIMAASVAHNKCINYCENRF